MVYSPHDRQKKHCPIIPYGWREALRHVSEGLGSVCVMKAGHAEIHGGETGSQCLGFMTKRSLVLFLKNGGNVS